MQMMMATSSGSYRVNIYKVVEATMALVFQKNWGQWGNYVTMDMVVNPSNGDTFVIGNELTYNTHMFQFDVNWNIIWNQHHAANN